MYRVKGKARTHRELVAMGLLVFALKRRSLPRKVHIVYRLSIRLLYMSKRFSINGVYIYVALIVTRFRK